MILIVFGVHPAVHFCLFSESSIYFRTFYNLYLFFRYHMYLFMLYSALCLIKWLTCRYFFLFQKKQLKYVCSHGVETALLRTKGCLDECDTGPFLQNRGLCLEQPIRFFRTEEQRFFLTLRKNDLFLQNRRLMSRWLWEVPSEQRFHVQKDQSVSSEHRGFMSWTANLFLQNLGF